MENNILSQLQNFLQENPQSFSIIEEKIDINLQMEYFKLSKQVKEDFDLESFMLDSEKLFSKESDEEDKKKILVGLASMEDVEAFRTIEKFYNTQEESLLKNWASLALRESKMMLETSLLDQKQVLISTGLGGKGTKLRYFIVLIHKDNLDFNDTQKKVIRNEFEIALNNNSSEIESISYEQQYSKLLSLIPLNIPIKETLQNAVAECNEYGNFLSSNFIVTNVKELSNSEIDKFIEDSRKSKFDPHEAPSIDLI